MLALTVRLIASLAVVVGLMLLLARFTGHRMRGTQGSLVQVVHRQSLGRSAAVAVVAVGDRVLLLGTTEQQVSLLTELDPDTLWDEADLFAVPESDDDDDLLDESSSAAVVAGALGARPAEGGLAGSVLSADTWRQAAAVFSRRSS